jgi:hypothetical protein
MSLNLSEAQLQQIANKIFILNPSSAPLPKPINSTGSLSSKLNPIAQKTRFKDLGIGVVDFKNGFDNPKVWLHNGDKPWRIFSSGKLSILLAAVQLRNDVRKVIKEELVATPEDLDTLFSKIWKRSKESKIRDIATNDCTPRVSTIFDFDKDPIDFDGWDKILSAGPDRTRLTGPPPHFDYHLNWKDAPKFTFWERLWMTGARSDNLAATTCISEIGVPYLKAVQRAYGLFNPAKGMHLLLAGIYVLNVNVNVKVKTSKAFKYRKYERKKEEHSKVSDAYLAKNKTTGEVRPIYHSSKPGSAAALTAYMIALMQGKLVDEEACNTIRYHLASEKIDTTGSAICDGVEKITAVTKAYTKIGVGTKEESNSLSCEFAYLEAGGLKYAVIVTGLVTKKVGTTTYNEKVQGQDLGEEIHKALI